MAATCPICGSLTRDREFCDRCHAELVQTPALRPPPFCPLTPEGTVPLTEPQQAALSRPEASVIVQAQGSSWRLHWIAAPLVSHWQPLVEERLSYQAACLPQCRLIPSADGFWVAAEVCGHSQAPWKERELLEPLDRLRRLDAFL